MSLHAIDDIGDAIDATKSLFLPVSLREWLKLAFVVFFIGGGGGGLNNAQSLSNFGNQGGGGGGGGGGVTGGTGGEFGLTAPLEGVLDSLVLQTGQPPIPPEAADALGQYGHLIIAAVVVLLLLFVLYGLLSNFMEFVFTQSLIDREVHVRQYFRQHVGNGIQLLLFRLAVNILTLLAAVGFGGAVYFLVLNGSTASLEGAYFTVFTFVLLFIVVAAVVVGVVSGFTTVFVVPLMASQDSGVLGGWRRLLSSMTSNVKQYLGYLFFSIVLAIGVGIVSSIVGVIVFLVVGIPFAIVGFGLWTVLGQGTAAIAVAGLVGVLFLFVVTVLSSMIQAPLQAFLRYYAMLVLGDIDESLDPIPEVRSDVRA